jgi:hypothetical protein
MRGASAVEAERGGAEGCGRWRRWRKRRHGSAGGVKRLGDVGRDRSTGGLVCLREEGVVSDDARLAAEALLFKQEKGPELDEGGEAAARHVGNGVLKALVEAAQNVVDELAVLDARAKVSQCVGHVLHLRGVVDDREIALVEAVELIAKEGRASIAVVAEDGAEGAPQVEGGDGPGLDDRQGGGGDGGVEPGDDGEVVEHPVGGALSGGAVDVVPEAELGEGGDELAAPDSVVVLLVIESDEDVVADAQGLELGRGEGLCCNGDAEILDGTVVGVRRAVEEIAHGGGVGGERQRKIGSQKSDTM